MLKQCRICRVDKLLDEFHRDKSMKDGYMTVCKECRKIRGEAQKKSVLKNGYIRTPEQRERMRAGHLGIEPWNKGTGGCKNGHDPKYYVQLPSGVYYCKKCKRDNAAKYRAKNIDRLRIEKRVGRYNITEDYLKEIWVKQNGICAICGEALDSEKYRIDHDHNSGKVRGILCHSCNTGIGLLRDSPEILHNATRYLENARE